MKRMHSKQEIENIALNKVEEGKINKTVIVYDGDENPEYPISIDFSQELCNEYEQPSLEVKVGSAEDEVGNITLQSGLVIDFSTPISEFYLDDEGTHIETANTTFISSSSFTNAFETGEVQYTDTFTIRNGNAYLVSFDDHNSLQIAVNGITINPDLESLSSGLLKIRNLPTSDPQVVNAVWNDNGTLKISSGQ